jgi:hypothetical protein
MTSIRENSKTVREAAKMFDTIAEMRASTDAVAEGDEITAQGYRYIVAASDATDHHITRTDEVKLYVQPAPDGAFHSRAFDIVPSANNTTEMQAFWAAVAGRRAVVNYHVAPYIANYLFTYSGTHMTLEPGVRIIGANDGSSIIIYINGAEDVTISAYGAYIELPANDRSHALNITKSKRILIEGLEIKGAGLPDIHESDCIYVGGDPDVNDLCEDIVIRDVHAYHARRNILSIVGCHGILVENCVFHTTLEGGTFMKGIDLEANKWTAAGEPAVKRVVIRKCRVYNTHSDCILISWTADVKVEDCDIFGSATGFGINITPGSHVFSDDRNPLDKELFGVISIDDATGFITVSSLGKLVDDYGIQPGMVVVPSETVNGTWPAEADVQSYYRVAEISADQLSMKIVLGPERPAISSFTGTGTGTLDEDPAVSDLLLAVYRGYSAGDIVIKNCRFEDDIEFDSVRIAVGFNVTVENCIFKPKADRAAVKAQYSRLIRVRDNKIYGGGYGLNMDDVHIVQSSGNLIFNTSLAGVNCTHVGVFRSDGDVLIDCGASQDPASQMYLNYTYDGKISSTFRESGGVAIAHAIRLHSDSENILVDGSNFKGCTNGVSNIGTNNRVVNCIQPNGSWST